MKRLLILVTSFIFILSGCGKADTEMPNPEKDNAVCGQDTGCSIKNEREKGYKVGDRIPNIALTDINGKETKLYDLMEGKDKFILNLSADWCSDCQREKDKLSKEYANLPDNVGVAVVYLNFSKDDGERSTSPEQIKKYIQEEDYPFPVFVDDGSLLKAAGVTSIPVNFVLDATGVIKGHTEEIDMDNLLLSNQDGEFRTDSK